MYITSDLRIILPEIYLKKITKQVSSHVYKTSALTPELWSQAATYKTVSFILRRTGNIMKRLKLFKGSTVEGMQWNSRGP